jgi:hypothetical protein
MPRNGTPVHVSIIPNEERGIWYVRVHFYTDSDYLNRIPPFPMNMDFPMMSEQEAKALRDSWNLIIENAEVQAENDYLEGVKQ